MMPAPLRCTFRAVSFGRHPLPQRRSQRRWPRRQQARPRSRCSSASYNWLTSPCGVLHVGNGAPTLFPAWAARMEQVVGKTPYGLAGTGWTKVTLSRNNPTLAHPDRNNWGITGLLADRLIWDPESAVLPNFRVKALGSVIKLHV